MSIRSIKLLELEKINTRNVYNRRGFDIRQKIKTTCIKFVKLQLRKTDT